MAIDILESKVVGTNKETWYKLIGTKDDTKPTGEFPAGSGHTVAKDSTYFEIGTEIRYEFDGSTWQPKGQVDVKLITKDITQNGTYKAVNDNADGYSEVDVEVPAPTLISKSITANGTYVASSDNADGYSQATVNVPQVNNAKVVSYPSVQFTMKQGLESINIPDGEIGIGSNAFNGYIGLKSITIPNTVTQIQGNAFYNCAGLTTIDIPSSVTTIETSAFNNCTALTNITINKPEGSISGAPWGATNATVTWTG